MRVNLQFMGDLKGSRSLCSLWDSFGKTYSLQITSNRLSGLGFYMICSLYTARLNRWLLCNKSLCFTYKVMHVSACVLVFRMELENRFGNYICKHEYVCQKELERQ